MRYFLRGILLAGVLGVVLLLGVRGLASHPRPALRMTAARPVRTHASRIGHPAPDLVLREGNGRQWRLARLRGRKVLLLFLCECGRCKELGRAIARRSTAWPGLQILAISHLDPAVIPAFQREIGLAAPFLIDPFGDVAATYDSLACPRSWVLDEKGRVLFVNRNPADPSAQIVQEIHRYVNRT